MIALVVLSQLQALAGEVTIEGIVIPIVSALAFLVLGGYIAVFILPNWIRKYVLVRFDENDHARVELGILFFLILVLLPATYYAQASYLMGCFVAGLVFCSFHELHHAFVRQFKRILQWLMRIFFAASIGFQVPINSFLDGEVIWQGLVYTLALIGKLAVGFMVPNFSVDKMFQGKHLRDCLITGFSMAAEGEFAFVIAVFAVGEGLIDKTLYAKVVLAVLLSTIIPPFLLRFTISYYNKKGEEAVEKLAEEEDGRRSLHKPSDEDLILGIKNMSTVFLCIQTQSEATWGLLNLIMSTMAKVNIFDHFSLIIYYYL
jgi:Kef-type K+ transport system membrane component KefB